MIRILTVQPIENRAQSAQFERMNKRGLTESARARWTRAEHYLDAMGRERSARVRRAAAHRPRSEPETPRLLLSTAPFLGLITLLGVLAVGIMVAAFPGSQPVAKAPQPAPRQPGVAPRGWLQEAQADFHRQPR